jgi:CHAT domain-containing protein
MIPRICHPGFSNGACIGYIWLLLLLLFTNHEVCSQQQRSAPFLSTYNDLMATGDDVDITVIDSTVNILLAIHQQSPGTYDSLVPSMLIWHYDRKSKTISPDERMSLLNTYHVTLQKMQQPFHEEFAKLYSLYLPLFRIQYKTDSIAFYLDLMEDHLEAIHHPVKQKFGWYYEKGRYAFSQGDYEVALTFSRRGLEYLERFFPDQLRSKYLLINAIGIGYRRIGETDEAIAWYEDILERYAGEINSVRMTGAILNNLGLGYKDCGDWENAISRLSDAIAYYTMTFSPTYEDIGSGYDNIAICYQAKGEMSNALRYSQKSLDFIRTNLGASHPDLLLPMNSITSTYFLDGNIRKAQEMNIKTQALMVELGWSAENPEGDYYQADGFDVFAYAIDIERALYDQLSDTSYLMQAIQAGARFMAMTDYAYDNLKNDLSKEIFQSKHDKVFSLCIRDLFILYEMTHEPQVLEKAFAYSEKFKSLELLYAAQKDKADHVERFRILNQQYNAQMDSIRHYEELYYSTGSDAVFQAKASSALNKTKESLYLWKDRIKLEHPDYYQLIYHPDPVSIANLQHTLDKSDQCILSYHLSDDYIYMFVIKADTAYFVREDIGASPYELITGFRKSVYGFFSDTSRSESVYVAHSEHFVKTGYELYSLLIEPVSSLLDRRVVIIVDKVLGYIPFDLLLKEKPKVSYRYRDHHYLLDDHAISYSYSARLWMDMRRSPSMFANQLLGVAPYFPSSNPDDFTTLGFRSGLTRLYYNETEVRDINHVIPGRILSGRNATKNNFIQHSSSYQIIHLATHSKANDNQGDYSFLAFTDTGDGNSTLLASEIYNLDLQAELVTLSACETGLGELTSAEGIISLARAFSYAGAGSIVSSLWSVNDKSTPSLMAAFYHHLKQGIPKDVALQKAKMDFIHARGHTDTHPFYWGGFICVGDMSPVLFDAKPDNTVFWILGGGAVLLIILFFIKNFRRLGTT